MQVSGHAGRCLAHMVELVTRLSERESSKHEVRIEQRLASGSRNPILTREGKQTMFGLKIYAFFQAVAQTRGIVLFSTASWEGGSIHVRPNTPKLPAYLSENTEPTLIACWFSLLKN